MLRHLKPFLLCILILFTQQAAAQMARNPKLSPQDLETAQSQTREAGGQGAELIYAARLDVLQKGDASSLIIFYAKSVKNGKEYFAHVLKDGKRYPIQFDKQGRVLKVGDKFLRIGLRHEEGKPPLLRVMAETIDPAKGVMQRNLDYKFIGGEFLLVDQSVMTMPK